MNKHIKSSVAIYWLYFYLLLPEIFTEHVKITSMKVLEVVKYKRQIIFNINFQVLGVVRYKTQYIRNTNFQLLEILKY